MGRKEQNTHWAETHRSAIGSRHDTRGHRTGGFAKDRRFLPTTGIAPMRKLRGRFGRRRLAVLATCAAFGGSLTVASVANAEATWYSRGQVDCVNFQVGQNTQTNGVPSLLQGLINDSLPTVSGGTLVYFQRPVNVYSYQGTANLYWAPYVKVVNNQTGASASGQLPGVYPWRYVWRISNGWLFNLWWNQQSPPTIGAFYDAKQYLPPGYTAYVWGVTYWLNSSGTQLYHEYHYYGQCSA